MYGKSIFVPVRSLVAYQPSRVYPALVGVVGAVPTVLSTVVVLPVTDDPPFEL